MIQSERFYLRKYKLSDAPIMFKNWTSDVEVTKYLSWDAHLSVEDTENYIKKVLNNHLTDFAIVEKGTENVIGSIGKVGDTSDFSKCEVGYVLSKEYWHKGIMTEVLNSFLDYLFNKLDYKFVEARYIKENLKSGLVMSKCGMKLSYISKEPFDKFGFVDVAHLVIDQKSFNQRKIQTELYEKLDINMLPLDSLKDSFKYLKEEGYNVETHLFYDNRINDVYSPYVYYCYEETNLTRTYYFIAKKSNRAEFTRTVKRFIDDNKASYISNGRSLENVVIEQCIKKNLHLSCAESCNGGLIISSLIGISGASNVINESYVTYSNDAKVKLLGVRKKTLDEFTVYSKEVAKEMVTGLYNKTRNEVCISVTGKAGGSVHEFGDGSYDYGIYLHVNGKEKLIVEHNHEKGVRNEVRNKQVETILFRLLKELEAL